MEQEKEYIHKLGEEEAKTIILEMLLENKGKLTAREIIEEFPRYRRMGRNDLVKNIARSGAPMYIQIIQNATDRTDCNSGIYYKEYLEVVSPPPHKVVKLTESGRRFAIRLRELFNVLLEKGLKDIISSTIRQLNIIGRKYTSIWRKGINLDTEKTYI